MMHHETEKVPAESTRAKECTTSEVCEQKLQHDNVIDIIKAEHALVKRLYHEYQNTSDVSVKEQKACQIVKEIVHHSGKEEIALYPQLRKYLPNGDQAVEHYKQEHQEVTNDLYELTKLKYNDDPAKFNNLLSKIMTELEHHVEVEETSVLPQFAKSCPKEEQIKIRDAYVQATVTDLPHPSAPREGILASAAHMASKPIDAAYEAIAGKQK